DIGRRSESAAARYIVTLAYGGEHYYRGAGDQVLLMDLFEQCESVHLRHMGIKQDQPKGTVGRDRGLQFVECVRRTRYHDWIHSFRFDHIRQNTAASGVIVHD